MMIMTWQNNIKGMALKWMFIVAGFLFFTLPLKANRVISSKDSLQVKYDSGSAVDLRIFPSQQLDEYRQSSDFQYETDTGEALSWWDRLKNWFWEKIWQAIDYGAGTGWGKAILILAVIGLIIYVAIKMAGVDKGWFLDKKNRNIPSFYTGEEDVHSINFDQAISEAVQQHNYKAAVRLWYLMTLKKLTDKGLINWKAGKTNHEYVRELMGSGYDSDFIQLTNNFEFCWYGKSSLNSSDYEIVQHHFSIFNQRLS